MTRNSDNATDTARAATEAFQELATAAQYYLDMLYACDADMAGEIFHPRAQLYTFETGELIVRTVEEYKAILRSRTSPKSIGAPREDQVMTLDLAAPTQGLVKLKMRINDLVFIDYLTVIRLPEGWRIMSKVYHRLSDG